MVVSNGRLPASIYWRRRLLALAALILVIWLIVTVIGAIFGGDGETEKPAAKAPATTAPVAEGIVPVQLATDDAACDPQDVKVTPSVPSGQKAGGNVAINLLIGTIDGKPCTLKPSDADLLVVISSTKAPVYDSMVCRTTFINEPIALAADWATQFPTTWTGRGSGKSCKGNEGYASAGTYRVQAGTLGGEPGEATFTLDKAPKPAEPTATPTPTESPTLPSEAPADED